jgi:hypothetical protein
VHLGQADLGGDLGLGHVVEESQGEDALFPRGECGHEQPQCQVVIYVGVARVGPAEQVDAVDVGSCGVRRVQRYQLVDV